MELQKGQTRITYSDTGSSILLHDGAIEKVAMKGLQVELITQGDGTEIIKHCLDKGQSWSIQPAEGWDALESIYVLEGSLRFKGPEGDILLKNGNSFSSNPIKETAIFIAETNVTFLYITSQPVFHFYSKHNKEMLDLAVRVEEKDGYTAEHCNRIKELALKVGQVMNLRPQNMTELNLGAFLHDLGKVKVPDSILGKPSKLTNEEFEIIKQHPRYGREILHDTQFPLFHEVGYIVEQHHERYDGKGYPYGLKEDQIKIESYIVSVVDSYDAMTSERVYSKPKTKEEALAEIVRCKGTMYHPDVVDAFISISDQID